MKKVIALVDTNNWKFLIIKEDNCWNLPVLENIKDTKDIRNKFFDKYKIYIYKI